MGQIWDWVSVWAVEDCSSFWEEVVFSVPSWEVEVSLIGPSLTGAEIVSEV